jgi:hypothetical protein
LPRRTPSPTPAATTATTAATPRPEIVRDRIALLPTTFPIATGNGIETGAVGKAGRMQATTTPPNDRLRRMQDAGSRTPPWAWRLAATVAGMAAAALVGKAIKAGRGRMRSRSALVRWPAALALTAVAAIAASKGRDLARGAVTQAWNRRSA